MATEVPRYSDSIYKSLRGLRRDVPEYTEENYKMRVPVSNRICTGMKVHYSKIPVDCYCPKYGFFEQKVIVGRTLIFFDKETLTFTKSRQRNAFNHFWDVSEKPYIPFADREKEKEASEYKDKVARGQSTRWKPETSGQDENNVKVKHESGQNPKSEPEKSVVHVEESDDIHTEACATNQNDVQDHNKAVLYCVTKSKDEPVSTHYAADNRYSLMLQPYSAYWARATDFIKHIKHMRLSITTREEIVGDNIFRRKPEISISSNIVTADLPSWLPTVNVYVETTGNYSERNRMIQPYSACCARTTDLIKHMRLSMSNRKEILSNVIIRRKPQGPISSYIVTANLPSWLPTVDIYDEMTGNYSERNRVIQPYSACCARAMDIIKHMWLSMSNREDIIGDTIHVEKVEDDSERNVNTATFQNGDFENALTNHEPPKYGNETCILGNDATFENECQLQEPTVNIKKIEQDYNIDSVTGILGIYARGQEHYNIENILTNTDNNDDEDHAFMSGLFGVYARD